MKSNPPPNKGKSKHTVDLLIKDLIERKKAGKKKYGVAHQSDNGRNHLLDLYEELMDACVYIRAQLEQLENENGNIYANVCRCCGADVQRKMRDGNYADN